MTAQVPDIETSAKNHQGDIVIRGMGAHVHATVSTRNIRLPQTSLNFIFWRKFKSREIYKSGDSI